MIKEWNELKILPIITVHTYNKQDVVKTLTQISSYKASMCKYRHIWAIQDKHCIYIIRWKLACKWLQICKAPSHSVLRKAHWKQFRHSGSRIQLSAYAVTVVTLNTNKLSLYNVHFVTSLKRNSLFHRLLESRWRNGLWQDFGWAHSALKDHSWGERSITL